MKDPALEKTIEFCQTFDKFFDCLNVSSLDLGKHSRNAFKSPYHHAADFRIKVQLTITIEIYYLHYCSGSERIFLVFWINGRKVLRKEKVIQKNRRIICC